MCYRRAKATTATSSTSLAKLVQIGPITACHLDDLRTPLRQGALVEILTNKSTMTTSQTGLLIGGVLPAIIFGISGLFQKWGSSQGLGLGGYVVSVGLGCLTVGAILWFTTGEQNLTFRTGTPAFLLGFFWAMGVTAISFALSHYGAPLSKITPLYNMNTLVTVIGALILFAEWKDVHLVKLTIGTLLILTGSVVICK